MAMIFTHHYFNKVIPIHTFVPFLSFLVFSRILSPPPPLPNPLTKFAVPAKGLRSSHLPAFTRQVRERLVVYLPLFYRGFLHPKRWLAFGNFWLPSTVPPSAFCSKILLASEFRPRRDSKMLPCQLPPGAAWSSAWERSLGSGRHRAKETSSLLSKASHKAACKWSLAMVFASHHPKQCLYHQPLVFRGKKNLSFSSQRLTGCYFSTHLKNMLVKMDQFRK